MVDFTEDIEKCKSVLNAGELILYPNDTIWGIGCDATNEEAVNKIFDLKKREDSKSMIVLISNANDIQNYVRTIPTSLQEIFSNLNRPTTIIYEGGMNLAKNVLNADGSVAIRIVNDPFCRSLITEFGRPIVSTSANVSGSASPKNFKDIGDEIKNGVDYIVRHRQDELEFKQPSSIIKIGTDGKPEIIR